MDQAEQDAATAPYEAETAPAAMNDVGVAMHGEYPLNARLRAEAIVADGVETDPDGLIDDDMIADTAERLAAEESDRVAAERAAPSLRWSRDALATEAARLGVAIESDANKAAILAAIEAAPAAGTTEG